MMEKCKKCHGKGRIKCDYCTSKSGRSQPEYFSKNCPQCKGKQMVVCPKCAGKGQIDTPEAG
ncbi:MAG: hypothetical protein ABIH00_05670 [Armatimonadota bacterium]